MAFITTSDSIVIDAALTEKGRKHMVRGTFKISKFALGDDEIDYTLCDPDSARGDTAGLKHSKMFEACTNEHKNIQYGLNSFDKGILYLKREELQHADYNPEHPHAFLTYLPILKQNKCLKQTPSLTGSVYCVSVNDETTEKINQLASDSSEEGITKGFRFIQENKSEKIKFVVETGIDVPPDSVTFSSPAGNYDHRRRYIIEKFLLDQDFIIYADNRLVSKVLGSTRNAKFQNFPSNQSQIELDGLMEMPPVSLENQFDDFATFIIKTTDNLISDFTAATSEHSVAFSDIRGPRGSVGAFNIKVTPQLKINSTGTRDLRYTEFGHIDQTIFGGSTKFDYIDTAIYVVGATTNSQIQIPIRLIRYSGT
tara:strand:- start:5795 stop:6898 length:1104 start_codon:yes stop_codon:yes gene_type:complete